MSTDMRTTIRLPLPLRPFAKGAAEVTARGATVGAVLDRLRARHPELGRMLFTEGGELRGSLHVFVGTRNIRDEQDLDTPLDAPLDTPLDSGSVITIVPSVVGGRRAS